MGFFARLMNLIRGFFGSFISGLEKDNPQALIESEKENLRNQIAKYNENLANAAAFVERLKRTVKNDQMKEKELSAKIKANVSVGNNQVAGQLALQYQDLKARIADNTQQLELAESNYRKLESTRDSSVREAENKLMKLQNKLSETQMYEAQAQLHEMANGMITGLNSGNGNLDRVSALIDERRDQAVGRVRVAGGTALEDQTAIVKQAEMDALGNAALAEFMSMNDMGNGASNAEPIMPEAVVEVDPSQRNMGPTMTE